jgi:hypothetical protein
MANVKLGGRHRELSCVLWMQIRKIMMPTEFIARTCLYLLDNRRDAVTWRDTFCDHIRSFARDTPYPEWSMLTPALNLYYLQYQHLSRTKTRRIIPLTCTHLFETCQYKDRHFVRLCCTCNCVHTMFYITVHNTSTYRIFLKVGLWHNHWRVCL